MTRAAQVMDVMRRAPGQEWTAAEISAQLGCAPNVVRTALAGLRVAGQVERVGEGQWKLAPLGDEEIIFDVELIRPLLAAVAKPSPRAAEAFAALGINVLQPVASARPADVQPVRRESTPAQRTALIQALRDAGRPLRRSELQTRALRLTSWEPGDFFLTVNVMLETGHLREWADRTLVLPGWRGRL